MHLGGEYVYPYCRRHTQPHRSITKQAEQIISSGERTTSLSHRIRNLTPEIHPTSSAWALRVAEASLPRHQVFAGKSRKSIA
jgi:hypothetical protein